MEALSLFTEKLEPEIEEKIKYAKWRAVQINKSLGNQDAFAPPDDSMNGAPEEGQHGKTTDGIPIEQKATKADAGDRSDLNENGSISTDDIDTLQEAEKYAKYAINAIQYEDVSSAKSFLLKSVELLDQFEKR